ncbi:MAG: hypothetical protein LUQ55_04255 [Methanomassiliicoccales archaeon]|nr:hypothetical protein [Methanomassiliicoccales archaeon]
MKIIGIMTDNFRFFYQIAQDLKERGEPFISLGFEDHVPSAVGVIVTTEAEETKVRFHTVVADDKPEQAIDVASAILKGGKYFESLIIGIDPGSRPGLAVLGDGKVLFTDIVQYPEQVADALDHILACFAHSSSLVRIGHGDRTNRNRIIKAVWNKVDEIEIVDETNTTTRSDVPDVDAALSIATSSGHRLSFPPEIRPTAGEVRDIQRLSRIESGGRVTISSELAEAVARGELTLDEALKAQDGRVRC